MKVFLMVEWLLGFPNLTNFLLLEGNTHGCMSWGRAGVTCRGRKLYFNTRPCLSRSCSPACGGADGGHAGIAPLGPTHPGLRLLPCAVHDAPMTRAPASNGLCRLSAYLEELEAVELKKFKLYLGTEAEASRIPWGRLEPAGPLDTARLLVVHCGPDAAWRLALGLFQRINRRDLWERGQREEPLRGKEAAAAGALPLATVAARTRPGSSFCPWPCSRCVLPTAPPLCRLYLENPCFTIRTLEALPCVRVLSSPTPPACPSPSATLAGFCSAPISLTVPAVL